MAEDSQNVQQVLESSKEPKELTSTALTLAKSSLPNDHTTLLVFLKSEDFLARIDSEQDYQAPSTNLRIARILRRLSKNNAISARQILVSLTQDQTFISNWSRADILIQEVKVVKPSPPEVIKFWDDHCQPEDGFMQLTIEAIVDNGSEPAMMLLEKKLTDEGFDDDTKTWWMHTAILSHRNNILLLNSCDRILNQQLPERLRPVLIESLFDYQPDEWYGPDHYYKPPLLAQFDTEAKRQLQKIGKDALQSIELTPEQKAAVEKTLELIGEDR